MNIESKPIEKRYDNTNTVSFKGFVSENKFRSKKEIEDLANLEDEIAALEKKAYGEKETKDENLVLEPSKNKEPKEPSNEEDESWKKRYADLRRYEAKKSAELKAEIDKLNAELQAANNKPVKYPKTEEELKDWIEKFPDVADIIRTIALKENEATKAEMKKEVDELRTQRLRIEQQKAYNHLLELQPDFESIRVDPKFAEYDGSDLVGGWLFDQPETLQAALFRPSFDEKGVKAASRVIDLYKNEIGVTKQKSTPENKSEEKRKAATDIKTSSREEPQTHDGILKFTESQVQKMSTREYAKYADAIDEAMAKGPPYFVMDITGAAR